VLKIRRFGAKKLKSGRETKHS